MADRFRSGEGNVIGGVLGGSNTRTFHLVERTMGT